MEARLDPMMSSLQVSHREVPNRVVTSDGRKKNKLTLTRSNDKLHGVKINVDVTQLVRLRRFQRHLRFDDLHTLSESAERTVGAPVFYLKTLLQGAHVRVVTRYTLLTVGCPNATQYETVYSGSAKATPAFTSQIQHGQPVQW